LVDEEFKQYTDQIKVSLANCKAKITKHEENELESNILELDKKIEQIKLSKAQKNKQMLAPELRKIILSMEK